MQLTPSLYFDPNQKQREVLVKKVKVICEIISLKQWSLFSYLCQVVKLPRREH